MKTFRGVLLLLLILFVLGLSAQNARGQGVGFAQSSYATGQGPNSVVVGDFNGDGKLDVATANSGASTVSVLLGNGDGTFGTKTDFPTGTTPAAIAAGDLNGDSKLDLVTCNFGADKVSVLLGNGDGTFGAKTDFATATGPTALALADFNGDGKLDVVVAASTADAVSILPGNGNGTLGAHAEYPTGSAPASIVAGDFNGDGKLDVATANNRSDSISILLGNGDGTFGAKTDFAVSTRPVSLARGDFNADSKLDLVTAAHAAAVASVLLGKGDGTFNPKTDLGTDTEPIAVTAADFNADGKLDALAANLGTYTYLYYGYSYTAYNPSLTLALGDGTGNFSNARFWLSSIPTGIATGDFNADGRIDLAIANSRNDSVTILLQSAILSLDKGALDFGRLAMGTTSSPQTINIQSTGSFALNFSSVALAGTDASQFSKTGDTCSGAPLPSGSSCTITMVFSPTTKGAKSASLVLNHNAPGSPHSVDLYGMSAGQGVLTPSPAALNFGSQKVGTSSTPQPIQLTNTGPGALTILGIGGPGEFTWTTTCGSSLAASASCTISVTYVPGTRGAQTGRLSIDTDTLGSPTIIPLSGTGVGAVVSFVPSSVSFGSQAVNTTSLVRSVTLTNSGDLNLVISAIGLTNTVFSQINNCPGTLVPAASCLFNVTFTPLGSTSYTGSLSITDDAAGSPHTVGLDGTGFSASVVSLSPSSLNFGNQIVGTSSAAKTVTLTNTGGTVLNISSLTVSGDYSKTDNCGASVAPQGSCTINVTFTPTAIGARNGTLTINDNATGSPHTVALTGTGVDFSVSVPAGAPTSASIQAGQSTSFTLNFPSNGFSGTVTLACSHSIPLGTCAVLPASVVLGGAGSPAATVTVTTTATSLLPLRLGPPALPLPGLRGILPWLVLLVGMALLLGRRRAMQRPVLAFCVVMLCAVMGAACAGSSAGPRSGTPPGTYPITVSATSSGAVRSIPLSVTVR